MFIEVITSKGDLKTINLRYIVSFRSYSSDKIDDGTLLVLGKKNRMIVKDSYEEIKEKIGMLKGRAM
jgi:hypothetical protein